MRARSPLALSVLALILGCGGSAQTPAATPTPPPAPSASAPASAPATAKAAAERVTEDTKRTTASGIAFIVPAGWSVLTDGAATFLTGPEPDLRITLVESSAKSADDAVAAAWPVMEPGFKRKMLLSQPAPGRRGWDELRAYQYETSPDEKLVVSATALRTGTTWLVLLIESSEATLEKRASAAGLFGDSLAPKGYAKESFAGKTPHTLDADRIKQITDLVEQGRQALEVPGVAFGLVQGGKVVFAGGLGVRELGKATKVDAQSLFAIASNTKALTTLLLAKEIDEGKFTWDTPVTALYPTFKLGDQDTTSKVLVKHLVCACTGLPRQDLEWLMEFKDATPSSEMVLLGGLQPTTKFGETFQYSNQMAAAAGFIGGSLAYPKKELGAAYDEAMKVKLLDPMGMKETTFDFRRAQAANHAAPHSFDLDGHMKAITLDMDRSIIPVRPAGGAWSSVSDMLKYVQMELDRGKLPGGKALVSESSLLARRAPQVAMDETSTYGMGLMVDSEWGIPIVHHGGDLFGYHSDMFWLPEQNIGGVILTNADGGNGLRRPFLRKVLEVLFDGKPEALEDVLSKAKRQKEEIAKARELITVPPDAAAVAKLAKRYHNDKLGDLVVTTNGTSCTIDAGEWKSSVGTRKNEDGTISVFTVDPGVVGFEFVVGTKDGKRVLTVRDAQHEYVMTEVP
jgi:CubicO group peptidase (beta-lactamase class C family)